MDHMKRKLEHLNSTKEKAQKECIEIGSNAKKVFGW